MIPEQFLNFGRLGKNYSARGSNSLEAMIAEGKTEASVIRTAGGRSMDCMRSLQVLDTVGNVGTVLVIHHTGKTVLL